MVETRRLQPHDPVPDSGRYMLVMKRFAEDAPQTTIVEIITADGDQPPKIAVPLGPDSKPLGFEEAVRAAQAQAERAGFGLVYAVDRTAGPREREIIEHHGDHAFSGEPLEDKDLEEGEIGADMREWPLDAGYLR